MRKLLLFCIILLVFLATCKKAPPAVTVIPENNITTDEKVEDKVYIDNSNRKYDELYVNEKYIVFEESLFSEVAGLWYTNGFSVYEYNKNLETTEYKDSGNKLYFIGDGPYSYDGIYNDLLFIDEGTGPDVRAIHIIDLTNNKEIFVGTYHGSYSFENNIVSGLTMSSVGYGDYDDNIKTRFYELMEDTETSESDNGLSKRFVVRYNYNVLTKEIYLLYGTYVYEQ